MKAGSFARQFGYSTLAVLTLAGSWSLRAHAQSDHAAMAGMSMNAQRQGVTDDNVNALVKIVREATERFKQVSVAENEGYGLLFGCVSGGDTGAMGMHFVNMALVGDGEIDARKPEIVIYEPLPNGKLRLIGADYLVLADAWNQKHPDGPPQLNGQLFHYFEAPNRFGLPPFYTLHVWAWKENPTGTFVNWHSKVSCDAFSGERR
jgi:hypothetical protein